MTKPLVLRNAAVVDTVAGSLVAGRDIRIADGMIVSIEPTGGALPDGAQQHDADVVDATGLYVAPGLIDMHAHPLNQADPDDALALMFLYGVTGFRQMSGTDELLARRAAGTLVFPPDAPALLATSGPVLTPMNAATPDAAVAEVARQVEAGADFIKAALTTTEVFFAAQAEANRLGIPLVGHLPPDIDAREAARAGVHSIEHLGPGAVLVAASSPDERELLDASAAPGLGLPSRRPPAFLRPLVERVADRLMARIVLNPLQRTTPAGVDTLRRALDTFDESRARELARVFRDHDTWQCPTLVRVKGQQLAADRAFEADPDLRFLTSATRDRWFRAAKSFRTHFSIEQRETFAEQYALQLRLVKIFDEEGVPLLAGTDAVGAVWVVPGASLHREFDELAAAGLSAPRILQIATIDAARFLQRDDLGRVATGYRADLLLLEENPLDDARNLRSIAGIVRDGAYRSPDDLTALHTRLIRSGVES